MGGDCWVLLNLRRPRIVGRNAVEVDIVVMMIQLTPYGLGKSFEMELLAQVGSRRNRTPALTSMWIREVGIYKTHILL